MLLKIPELALVLLIGPSGSGKSTFAQRHFRPTEVVSSDRCRGIICDDETDQGATSDAFELLHFIVAKRLKGGRLTVVDATNVQPEARKQLIEIAKTYHCLTVGIVFDLPVQLCHERNQTRPDRQFGSHVVQRHHKLLKQSLRFLDRELRQVHRFQTVEEIEEVQLERQPLWNNRQEETGPFDIIGDVHGCAGELEQLLAQLGYDAHPSTDQGFWDFPTYQHPAGRRAIFVGDLVDRGLRNLDTVKLVRNMMEAGTALCVCGNHEFKLLRYLRGKNVKLNHGLDRTVAELEAIPVEHQEAHYQELKQFLDRLLSHYVLDGGKLVIAHAGLKEEMQGRSSAAVRSFAMYGETTGETDEFGLPVRANWAKNYQGSAMVVYGHVPVLEAEWLNNAIDIDTGCVFGGKLTALRYPERELVEVPAAQVYFEPIKPLAVMEGTSAVELDPDRLAIGDVLGQRWLETSLQRRIKIPADRSMAALEVLSRFGVDPRWLIYIPPTMSPVATATEPGYLEYPTAAFDYYRQQGLEQVICEEKHMGSRAVVIVGRTVAAIQARFGVTEEAIGIVYTRTGRRFFNDQHLEAAVLERLQQSLSRQDFWQTWQSDWVCLDCELLPWSAKAQELIQQQYAAVGTAANHGLAVGVELWQQARARGLAVSAQQELWRARQGLTRRYVAAYRQYCWLVQGVDDLQLAPFHILATEGRLYTDQSHAWHMQAIAALCQEDSQWLVATRHRVVDLGDAQQVAAATDWWLELTAQGGEGMVVKALDFVPLGAKGLLQPAVKCRGKEYLRIIYGPEYDRPEYLDRLRQRSLGAKRALALREFALGVEGLERFVRQAGLRAVHECAFAVLALESEPIDPRL
jgi:protein phosphatase